MVAWILWSGFLDKQDRVLHYSQQWVGYEFGLVEEQDQTQDLHETLLGNPNQARMCALNILVR